MPLPDEYLVYPRRGYGMDHDFYEWSAWSQRPKITWPDGARVALWVNVVLEQFPLDTEKTPFPVPLGLERPYPDYWNYTLRDYGNRVGCYRLFRMLDNLGIKTSVAMNAALAQSTPFLMQDIIARGYEVIAHGLDMAHLHTNATSEEDEREWIRRSLEMLRQAGANPTGWLSPGQSQSDHTPKLLAEAGLEYCCDWSNDDMPYPFTGPASGLVSLPYPFELSDVYCMGLWHQTAVEFAEQILDGFHALNAEATKESGRVLALTLHASISGQPYRVKPIREALSAIMKHEGVWSAKPGAILQAVRSQP
ncbi:polysaccharide deacetylase family protein [Microvirga soli]|uniref:polysaccharide deacetylase family protein n=1 Tax=Microvirga soli TaxID=1854496 RepID=UPI00191F692F|nr:polysaccharide deacetylase family protein [Microvirga soli]